MGTMRTILIATTNRGKLREVREILFGLPVSLACLDDYPGLPEAVEDAGTFEGNAVLKARHYALLTGVWALADDSGLSVDALGGAPGVHSARYAGADGDGAANNAKLIGELARASSADRSARFCCAVALADRAEVLATSVGTWEGVVVDDPRGSAGFGYDPHFYVPSERMTAAEMNPELKNRLSHRGQAFRAIRPAIERLARERR